MIDYEDPDFDYLEAEYNTMYALVGYFIAQYSYVELCISLMLSQVCRAKDPEAFHALTKGMDAKTKIQRMRQLAKAKGRTRLGPKVDRRLVFIHDTVAEVRNGIAHAGLLKSPDDPQRIIMSAIGRIPMETFGYKGPSIAPKEITFLALQRYGEWLNAFQHDLTKMLMKAPLDAGEYEIVRPRSEEPPVFQQSLIDEDAEAKAHTHDGKPRLKSK